MPAGVRQQGDPPQKKNGSGWDFPQREFACISAFYRVNRHNHNWYMHNYFLEVPLLLLRGLFNYPVSLGVNL